MSIKLSGHHIENIRQYVRYPSLFWGLIGGLRVLYDESETNKNKIFVFEGILRRGEDVTMVDCFDDICACCEFRTDEGCLTPHYGHPRLIPLDEIVERNIWYIKSYNFEVGETYSAEKFLRRIGVR